MIEASLSKLGFSPSEIKIYVHLYKNGSSYANKISSETQINRTNVYEALDRLISKGVVSFIVKNNLKWVEAKSPESILVLVHEKEEELRSTKNDLLSDIREMQTTKKDAKTLEATIFVGKKGLRMIFEEILKTKKDAKTLEATIFVDKKGLRMIFEEILKTKKPISLIAAQLQFKEFFGSYFELWHTQRIEKGIKQRSIFSHRFKDRLEKRGLLEYRFVDDKFVNPTTAIIYGDTCLFIQ